MTGIRITSEILDEIKHIDIRDYLKDKHDVHFVGTNCLCPHPDHEDHHPSFSVWERNGYYYWCCHACHVGKKNLNGEVGGKNYGNDIIALIRWLSDYNNSDHVLTFQEAVKEACDYAGIYLPSFSSRIPLACLKNFKDNKSIAESCHKILLTLKNNEGQKYLFQRGLDQEDIDRWMIGYNGKRIVFPLFDRQKNILGFSNRVIDSTNLNEAKYKNSKTSDIFEKKKYLYGVHNLNSSLKYVYITEGQMDVIMATKFGLKNVIATLGTAFTEEHVQILKDQYKIENIIFIFDGDLAGEKALARSSAIVRKYGFAANFVELPKNLDLCEFALIAKDKLPEEIRARTLYYFFNELKDISEEYEKTMFQIQSRILIKADELRAKLNNKNEREMFSAYLINKFGFIQEGRDA